jgi:prevent-host-death family protein
MQTPTEISATEFKAKCLHLMDEVATTGHEYIINKHGKPLARLVPEAKPKTGFTFGCLKGEIEILGDIISPVEDAGWELLEKKWDIYYP